MEMSLVTNLHPANLQMTKLRSDEMVFFTIWRKLIFCTDENKAIYSIQYLCNQGIDFVRSSSGNSQTLQMWRCITNWECTNQNAEEHLSKI